MKLPDRPSGPERSTQAHGCQRGRWTAATGEATILGLSRGREDFDE